MTDADLAAIAAGFKTVIEEQGIELRAQIAALREDLQLEKAKGAEYREAGAASQVQLIKTIGDQLAAALPPAVQAAAERIFERRFEALSQRAIPGATQ